MLAIFQLGFSCPYFISYCCMFLIFIDFKVASVLDIMQLNPLPKVICVLKSWKGDDVRSSTVENEVLIVKQVKD